MFREPLALSLTRRAFGAGCHKTRPGATWVHIGEITGQIASATEKAPEQCQTDALRQSYLVVDVDNSKLPAYSVPQAGVEYMNLNQYTDTRLVQEMRDHVTQVYVPPQ